MVRLSELQSGDVIFTMVNETTAGHASIYTANSHFEATIIHAVNDDHKQIRKLMATSFNPSGGFLAFRCRNDLLPGRAAEYALHWVQYETPYDPIRINLKQAFMSKLAIDGLSLTDVDRRIEIMRRLFEQQGKFRAIKYAARRKYALCFPGEDETASNGRGLTCTMFAILCYQVAGLSDYVNTLDTPNPLHRVSDKKIDGAGLESLEQIMHQAGASAKDLIAYREYSDTIRSTNPYNIRWSDVGREDMKSSKCHKSVTSFTYYPSILFWKDPVGKPITSFNFGAAFTEGMLLDAKIASPTDMMLSLRKDEAGWEPLGAVEKEKLAITEKQKSEYQEKLSHYSSRATEKRLDVLHELEDRKMHWFLAWLSGVSHS